MREYFSFRRYCSGKKEKFAKPSFFWYDEKENVQNSIQNKIFVEIEKTLRGFIMERIEKKELKKLIRENVKTLYRKTLENASPEELYQAAVFAVRDVITDKWMKTHDEYYERDAKVVYYLSMEFLMGRFFGNALINLEMFDEVKEVFAELGIDYNMVEEAEPDPGLGNGGLGRLAACFLESLSTLSLPAYGCGIRYHYGIFEQRIENGYQVEVPDNWLENGDPWGIKRNEYAVEVKFGGNVRAVEKGNGEYRFVQENYQSVTAIPYDYPVIGYGNNTVNTLRLWEAKPKTRLDLKSFNEGNYQKAAEEELLANTLTDVLYPADEHIQGKELRLRQQYFFISATVQRVIARFKKKHTDFNELPDKVAFQLNDTHPSMAVAELMRVLVDENDLPWDQAWDITTKTMAYTNHTVLSEALEKWPIQYVQDLLPRVYMIIEEIDRRFKYWVSHDMGRADLMNECCVLKDGQVHMANLAIIGSHSVNGVAALHTEILIKDVMKNFYDIYPAKFNNKTNGITHRRWLIYSNPQLTKLLERTIGPDFKKNPERLIDLMNYVDDPRLQKAFMEVKMERKKILAKYIKDTLGIEVDVNSIFDVQAKRLHAYKRQLLNVMNIIHLYFKMKSDPNFRIYPRTFIFAAKAAPSYTFAKEVIKLIHCVADKVNNDSDINPYMKVVFIPNYGVSIAEILMNAADVSEQISTAGKEASGTGNMKFMMNGALTLGTMDGANVEIVERVGYDNAEIFGLRADDVALIRHENSYNVWDKYNKNPDIQKIVNSFVDSTFSNDPKDFKQIYNELMFKNDEYLLLADFEAYAHAQRNIEEKYRDEAAWARACLINIAQSGFFSSDRTIKQYADEIWDIHPIKVK